MFFTLFRALFKSARGWVGAKLGKRQAAHSINQLIPITGGQEADFAAVVRFLEENAIYSGKREVLRDALMTRHGRTTRTRYEIPHKGLRVVADVLEFGTPTERYLINAWVETVL